MEWSEPYVCACTCNSGNTGLECFNLFKNFVVFFS